MPFCLGKVRWEAYCAPILSTHSATLPQQMYNEPEARFFEFNYGPEYVLESIEAPIYLLTGAWCAALPACLGARLLCKCACAHSARLGKACCNALPWATLHQTAGCCPAAATVGCRVLIASHSRPPVHAGGRDTIATPADTGLTQEKLKSGGSLVGELSVGEYSRECCCATRACSCRHKRCGCTGGKVQLPQHAVCWSSAGARGLRGAHMAAPVP